MDSPETMFENKQDINLGIVASCKTKNL